VPYPFDIHSVAISSGVGIIQCIHLVLGHLVGLAVLDRPLRAALLLPLFEETLALGRTRLGRAHNPTVLVVFQVLLRQTARRVVGSAVHNFGARSNRRYVRTSIISIHLFSG